MKLLRGLLLLALLLVVPVSIYAQGVTTASISGTVKDTNGQPVPGATVIALHVPSGTKYGNSTQLDGRYYIRGMRVGGPYTITVSDVGYKTQEVKNVYLEIGQNLELNFKLTQQAVNVGGVEVIANAPGLSNTNRTGAATTVSRKFIESFPTITRSFQDFEALSPGFVDNSALGRNNKYNNIQIDGANYNDLFGLPSSGTPGGQAGTTPISLDAIQTFQVSLAPFDVRQGGFTGGEVNAITRSGTNRFEGSVYFFGQNQNFIGTSPNAEKTPYPKFSNVQTGFRLGGPIVKNKLFFFVNGEIDRERQPIENTSAASDSLIQAFINVLQQQYNLNPGTASTYTALTPSNKVFARIDYNMSETEKLSLRYNFVNANEDVISRSYNTLYLSSAAYTFNDKTNSIVAQLNSSFGSNLSNEAILNYTSIIDHRIVPNPLMPMIQLSHASGFSGGTIVAGTEQYSGANHTYQYIWELTDNLSLVAGSHLFTFGTHDESFTFNNLFLPDYYGFYNFGSLAALQAGSPSEFRHDYSNIPGVQQPMADWSAVQYGLYAQDEWSIIPNLKLTYGLRLDIPTFPTKPYNNPTFDNAFAFMGLRTDQPPKTELLWSPRLGWNWDINGDRQWVVRGGAGVFTGRVPYVWISNQYSNTGVDINRLDVTRGLPPGFFDPNPLTQPVAGGTDTALVPITTTEVDMTSPNFKMPQVFRVDLAVDHALPLGFVGTLEGLFTQSINDVMYQNLNIVPLAGHDNYVGLGGRPLYSGLLDSAFTRVVYMTNTNKPYEYDLTASLHRQFAEGIFQMLGDKGINDLAFLDLSYTFSQAYDQNAVTSSQAYSQWYYNPIGGNPNNPPLAVSDFSVPSRVVLSVSEEVQYAHGFATTLSLFYTGMSGSPFSYIYYGDVNGDGSKVNDLVYVPKYPAPGGDINLVVKQSGSWVPAPASDYTELANYINGDPYLSKYKGQIVPRNGGRSPWDGQLNLRLAQDIPTIDGQNIEFTLDILNVLNLLNHSWGYVETVPYGTYELMNYEGKNSAGQPTFQLTLPSSGHPWSPDPFYSRWQMQLGARYNF